MFSELAKQDLIALRQQGFEPTDEEVVKLNDIALRIERGKETTPVNAPRSAFAGNVVLHEPTIGAMLWWNDFGKSAARSTKWELMTYFFMLANAKNIEFLDSLETPKDINKAVKEWCKKLSATQNELWRALWYVKYGYDIPDESIDSQVTDEDVLDKLWATVCVAAGKMEIKPSDLRTETQTTLLATLAHIGKYSGLTLKRSVAQDYIRYKEMIRQIETRGKSSNGN